MHDLRVIKKMVLASQFRKKTDLVLHRRLAKAVTGGPVCILFLATAAMLNAKDFIRPSIQDSYVRTPIWTFKYIFLRVESIKKGEKTYEKEPCMQKRKRN